ncbi:hypothetical protein EJB05_52355, partial [Eragrostis curvula]
MSTIVFFLCAIRCVVYGLCINGATSKAHGEVTYQYWFAQDARKQSPWTRDLCTGCKREKKRYAVRFTNVIWKETLLTSKIQALGEAIG